MLNSHEYDRALTRVTGLHCDQADWLFLFGDVLQHEAGELRHQRAQARVFFEQPDDVVIDIGVKPVIILETRWVNGIAVICPRKRARHGQHS